MIPESQIQFPGMMAPSAPLDTYSGLGKNGQVVCAAPSKNVSFIRMGNGNNELVSVTILENIWRRMKWFFCGNGVDESNTELVVLKNNGANPSVEFRQHCKVTLYNSVGEEIPFEMETLSKGIYFMSCSNERQHQVIKVVVGEN